MTSTLVVGAVVVVIVVVVVVDPTVAAVVVEAWVLSTVHMFFFNCKSLVQEGFCEM